MFLFSYGLCPCIFRNGQIGGVITPDSGGLASVLQTTGAFQTAMSRRNSDHVTTHVAGSLAAVADPPPGIVLPHAWRML